MDHISKPEKQFKSIKKLAEGTIIPLSPFWELNIPLFVKTWILFTQGCFVPSLVVIGQVLLEKFSKYCNYFITLPLTRVWPIIWPNLNHLYPKMLCVKFGWNWPSSSGEEDGNSKCLQKDGQTNRWQVIQKAH